MKQSRLTSKIMSRILDIEKKRIRQTSIIFCVAVAIFFLGFLGTAFIVNVTLAKQETLSVLSLWQEDPEIIHDYFLETLDTVWEELPKGEVFVASIFLAGTVAVAYLFWKRYPKLEKSRKNLYAYATKNVNTMGENARSSQTIYYVFGTIIILILSAVILIPRIRSNQIPKNGKVSSPAEMPAPVGSAKTLTGKNEGETPEEKKAASTFTFSLDSPADGTHFQTAAIQVKGKTAGSADVFVNEIDGKADKDGNFSISYTLEEGDNYLVIGANDEYGNFEEKEITVFYDAPSE